MVWLVHVHVLYMYNHAFASMWMESALLLTTRRSFSSSLLT